MGVIKRERSSSESRQDTPVKPNIPCEIKEFIDKGKQALLIKGAPGTGKTTLALELLASADGNGVFITDKLSQARLFDDFPWIQDHVSEDQVFDISQAHTLRAKDELGLPEEYFELPDRLKPAVNSALSLEEGLIVFDHWDSIAGRFETMEKPYSGEPWNRSEIERLLLDTFAGRDVNLVFATEDKGLSELDYDVSGTATLREIVDEMGRRFRELELTKLRGTRVPRPAYPFSLRGARFHAFTPVNNMPFYWHVPDEVNTPPPIPDPEPGLVSTGWTGLGGLGEALVKGSINLLEVSECVGVNYAFLLMPPLLNALNTGRKVIILPSTTTPVSTTASYVFRWIKPESRGLVGVASYEPTDHDFTFHLHGSDLREDLEQILTRREEGGGDGPAFCVMGADTLEQEYGFEVIRRELPQYVRSTTSRKDVDIWTVKSYQMKLLDMLRPHAATHWKLSSLTR